MAIFARVPVVPGPVLEIYIGEALFPMHEEVARTFHPAPDGTKEGYQFDGTSFTPPVPPAVDPKAAAKGHIAALEAAITPRRIRDAVLGTDGGWLKEREAEIASLRAKV